MAVTERSASADIVFADQVFDGFGIVGQTNFGGHDFEQFAESHFAGVGNFDLVGDTSQECVVDQVLGLQVGREITSWSKGTWVFLPLDMFRKS